jgi:hypothetical protein
METLQNAANNAINAAGWATPNQVVVGLPASTELVKILNQKQTIVSISDRGTSRNVSRYPKNDTFDLPEPACPLSASVDDGVITFAGTSGAGINVLLFFGTPVRAAYLSPGATDTLETIATNAAAAINELAIAGVVATASGDGLSVTGSPQLQCNVGASNGSVAREVQRVARSLDLIVWASSPQQRFDLADILTEAIGTEDSRYFFLSDGTPLEVEQLMDGHIDSAQSSYSLWEHHIILAVEYGVLKTTPATKILAVSSATSIDGAVPITDVTGGP